MMKGPVGMFHPRFGKFPIRERGRIKCLLCHILNDRFAASEPPYPPIDEFDAVRKHFEAIQL